MHLARAPLRRLSTCAAAAPLGLKHFHRGAPRGHRRQGLRRLRAAAGEMASAKPVTMVKKLRVWAARGAAWVRSTCELCTWHAHG